MKNEKELLENYLKEKLDELNIKNAHLTIPGERGVPDRIIWGHTTIYVELKLGKENKSYYKLTPLQKLWKKQLSQMCDTSYYELHTRQEIDLLVEHIYKKCKENKIKNYFSYNTAI